MKQLSNKKDRLGNHSMTWNIRVGATGNGIGAAFSCVALIDIYLKNN